MRSPNDELRRLLPPQVEAVLHVEELGRRNRSRALENLGDILHQAGVEQSAFDEAMVALRNHARVQLHFHPDRLSSSGASVAEVLLLDGCYRNQFETGLSSGDLSAYPGGDRDLWEERLFGGAYHGPGVAGGDRPKYGALDLMRHPDGASPRFGSCYLVLSHAISARCSFTFEGSQSPHALEHSGTLTAFECVIAALLAEVARGDGALGVRELTVAGLLAHLSRELSKPVDDLSLLPMGRALDSFIEAQIHGAVDLKADAEKLVSDPAFRGTLVEGVLEAICAKYDIVMAWHPGFWLPLSRVPDDFRGSAMPPLARRIAGDGVLDVALIGQAARSLTLQPELWQDWGSHKDTLQHLKQLWHVLVQYGVQFGSPAS